LLQDIQLEEAKFAKDLNEAFYLEAVIRTMRTMKLMVISDRSGNAERGIRTG